MIKIPAADGKLYRVVSWTTFKAWVKRFSIGIAIIAIAFTVGLYYFGIRAQNETIAKINAYAAKTCPGSIKTINKYNGLVQSLIDARNDVLSADIAKGDKAAIARDKKAIAGYADDFLIPPTLVQCNTPILRK